MVLRATMLLVFMGHSLMCQIGITILEVMFQLLIIKTVLLIVN